jgi:hypothetical protein
VNGEVFKVDELDFIKSENMIGVSLQSGTTIGDSIKVKTIGVIKDQSWNWTVGSRIFIKNGNFSDIPPDDGHLISIGSAVSSNEINIKISEVVIL